MGNRAATLTAYVDENPKPERPLQESSRRVGPLVNVVWVRHRDEHRGVKSQKADVEIPVDLVLLFRGPGREVVQPLSIA